MEKIVDTHAHLNFKIFKNRIEKVIKDAKNVGVEKIIIPSANKETTLIAKNISEEFKNIYFACGIHPLYLRGKAVNIKNRKIESFLTFTDSGGNEEFKVKEFKSLLKKAVAIGEVGLDYYESSQRKSFIKKEVQQKILKFFFNLSLETKKPLILHIRPSKKSFDAFLDLIKISKKYKKLPKAVLHCYSAYAEITNNLLKLGFYFSFTQMTFYNEKIKESFKIIPIERIMLETDSPFLSPFKGKINEPKYLANIAKRLAELKNIPFEEFAKITYKNSIDFFNLY